MVSVMCQMGRLGNVVCCFVQVLVVYGCVDGFGDGQVGLQFVFVEFGFYLGVGILDVIFVLDLDQIFLCLDSSLVKQWMVIFIYIEDCIFLDFLLRVQCYQDRLRCWQGLKGIYLIGQVDV